MPSVYLDGVGSVSITFASAAAAASPASAYSAWALELGVSDTGTDQAMDGDDSSWPLTLAASYFQDLNGTAAALASFGSEGLLGLCYKTPASTVQTSVSWANINRAYTFADTPELNYVFHPPVDCQSQLVKTRKNANVTIIYGKIRSLSAETYVVYFALRIEPSKLTGIFNAVDQPVEHRLVLTDASNAVTSNTLLLSQPAGSTYQTESSLYSYKIDGQLSETVTAAQFIASAHGVETGRLLGRAAITAGAFTLKTVFNGPVYLTVSANQGAVWKPSTVYALDARVFPTGAAATPYYYKRVAAGTSGTAEPAWATLPGGQCDDGAVTNAWELVEGLIQPAVQGPLTPVPI